MGADQLSQLIAVAGTDFDRYLAGTASILAVVAVFSWGAWRLRGALLPDWTGAPARLAEVVMVLGAVFLIAEGLGSFGQFRAVPVLVLCLAAGALMGLVGSHLVHRDDPGADARGRPEPPPATETKKLSRPPMVEIAAVVIAGALVAAQWATHVAVAYSRGMTHGDTLWYQATFAARFVQTGRLTELRDTGLSDLATPLHSYIPETGSLVHAIVMLPFHNDLLSPLVNLGWAALTLLAAWCIGRRHGAGALTLLGAVLLLGAPTIAGTQPGQAANDIATAGLFFAAVALLLEGKLAPFPTLLAGVATGLALGIKLTVLVPAAVLTLGIVFVAIRSRRYWAVLAWCAGLLPFGAYWPIRNWLVAGNPFPWSEIHLGPITLSEAIRSRPALISVLDDSETWREFIFPGFSTSLGRGWFVILALAGAGAVLGFVRRRDPLDPWLGASVLVGFVAIAFIPFGADLNGGAFVFMVRYLSPEILVGFALLAIAVSYGPVVWRRIVLGVMAALIVLNTTAKHIEHIPAWPRDQIAIGVLVGVLVFGAATAALLLPPDVRRRVLVLSGAAVVVVAVAGGWALQQYYFDHRYVDAGLPTDAANEIFSDLRDQRVALIGTEHFYPFFGNDLSNRVSRVNGPHRGSPTQRCRIWRERIAAGKFDYLVLAHQPFSFDVPDESWISSDRAATPIRRAGSTTVYRIRGAFDPDTCP